MIATYIRALARSPAMKVNEFELQNSNIFNLPSEIRHF